MVEIDISESPRAVVDGLSLRTAEPCEKAMSSVASSRFAVITDYALSELFRVSALGAAIASEPDLSNSLLAAVNACLFLRCRADNPLERVIGDRGIDGAVETWKDVHTLVVD